MYIGLILQLKYHRANKEKNKENEIEWTVKHENKAQFLKPNNW